VVAALALAVAGVTTLGQESGDTTLPATGGPNGAVDHDLACAGSTCDPTAVAAAIQRPLHLPAMAADGSCPVSPHTTLPAAAGFTGPIKAIGHGALYLAYGFESGVPVRPADGHPGDGWMEQKVIWVFDKSYAGPVLLRGGRIDRPGPLEFLSYLGASDYQGDAGSGPRAGLLYVRGGLGAEPAPELGTTSAPSGIYVKSPGCYAIQVDGEGFSQALVFRVVRDG
jgi:hypothetical protein